MLAHTTHVNRVREEVRSVRDQEDQAALDLRVSPDMCELQQQTRCQSNDKTNRQAAKEYKQEEPDAFKQAQYSQLASLIRALIVLCRLKQHDSYCIVQDTLAKDDRVELRIDLVRVEDCEDRDGIGSRECRTNGQGVHECNVNGLERYARPEPDNDCKHNG